MRRLLAVVFVCSLVLPGAALAPRPAAAQGASCTDYDAWVWAQTVYETNTTRYAALDPDHDGIACPELPVSGFAPVLWAPRIPAGVEAAQIVDVINGDDILISIDGVRDDVHMYHMNAPETDTNRQTPECGGAGATTYLRHILESVPNQTVYLEYDQTRRDDRGRRLAYVWFAIGDHVYLVNEAMVRTGWAKSHRFGPDNKYGKELDAAQSFASAHSLGIYLACGGFGRPVGSQPSPAQVSRAKRAQPNQGQFAGHDAVATPSAP
jgi:micrococcal nuclease